MARILLATIGSHGDVNPYLALGRELKARGHSVALATGSLYREDAAREGLDFVLMGPEADPTDEALMRRALHPIWGSEVVVREFVMPILRQTYEQLEAASAGVDLFVSHVLTYAVPILAEKTRRPWVSTVLQPLVFFSAYDPPILPQSPALSRSLRRLGPGFHRALFGLFKRATYPWSARARELRRELGLPRGANPVFEGQHSPYGVLALFSGVFGPPQPDWPPSARACGFPFYDADFGGKELDPRVSEFLRAGPAPVVFSLGSSAVNLAGDFYKNAAQAARRLGRRALLLAGGGADALKDLPEGTLAVRSAPYHLLFPRCATLVLSGGIGTVSQALRSGRPQLVLPVSHDQFDNAARVERMGCGRVLNFSRQNLQRLERALAPVLESEAMARRAREISARIQDEDGVKTACDALESLLKNEPPPEESRGRRDPSD